LVWIRIRFQDQAILKGSIREMKQQVEAFTIITGSIANLAHSIDSVRAVGLSGSHARGSEDALSDIDICVYVAGELPSHQIRQRAYAQLGYRDSIYLDVDFEYSRGDGFLVSGTRCDFNWMSISKVQSFLQSLETDFDSPEFIPGGLSTVKDLYDPDRMIDRLKAAIPKYSDARAKHRIRKAINDAHFSLYDLGWLEKAAFRNDPFLFLKNETNILDTLFRIFFALNHVWLSDEKWLLKRIAGFEYVPEQIEMRIDSIILHQHPNSDLNNCLSSIKELFADTVLSIHGRYPDLDLPGEWR
jgi:predicted nucleotidyltransferase